MIVAYKIRRQGEPSFLMPNDELVQQELLTKMMETFPDADLLVNNTKNRATNKKIELEEGFEIQTNTSLLQVTPNPTEGKITIAFKGDLNNAKLTIITPAPARLYRVSKL